ncbi:signal transduction histidine kinase [Wenyingzhuangia heitensis]|uniref:histidine kinase n=1 Tax=Wenyingzhuangia heitensis TaxID=1487859 RepID=A0ABX0U9U0_9FLAO|nr:ATP-binding protein [Wenyingzhuangia heitensis]NIJ45604.1 signal transduction histidine kinase [Wenyingzhuangia heitensis]
MEISKHILNSYTKVNPYSATSIAEEKILEKGYLAVIDDQNNFHGILTTCDLVKKRYKLVIDCLTSKEQLNTNDTLLSSLNKFNSSQCSALPVFKDDTFIGIVEKHTVLNNLNNTIEELYNKSIISENLKESFLHNLSHEVRTPLNGLLGFLDLITDLNINNKESANSEYSSIIRKSADRLLLVLNDLVDLSLLNSGEQITIETNNFKIEDVLSSLKSYFEISIEESNKELEISYKNPSPSLVISADIKIIKHILYHLIDNAIKFSFEKRTVLYGYEVSGNDLIFFVKNYGPKISDDRKNKIFEVFEKQDYKNNELVDGLGIGLPLTKRFSELLNGKINLVSKETETTFFFTMPLKQTATITI